jgi:hypothetical protein
VAIRKNNHVYEMGLKLDGTGPGKRPVRIGSLVIFIFAIRREHAPMAIVPTDFLPRNVSDSDWSVLLP